MDKYKWYFSALLFVLIALGTWTYIQAEGGVITVCVNNDGTMNMIGTGFRKAHCDHSQQLISWNIHGLKGDTGPQGPAGPQGHDGQPSWDENRIIELENRVAALEHGAKHSSATTTILVQ